MTARRRQFLRLCGAIGIGGLAGCSGDSESEPPEDGATTDAPPSDETTADTDTPIRTPTATLTPTAATSPTTTTELSTTTEPSAATEPSTTRGDDPDVFSTPGGDTSTASSPPTTTATPTATPTVSPTATPSNTPTGPSQQTKLAADDGDGGDQFGWSVAISGDGTTALISAPSDADPNGAEAGSTYVFEIAGDTWSQQAKLAADDGDAEDGLGDSVALSNDGTTALIGAKSDEDPNGERAGSAYVFEGSDGTWRQRAKLSADDGDSYDYFGDSVALSSDGTTAIVGAQSDEDPNGRSAGSAYVFVESGGAWRQQTKLAADDGDSSDNFGTVAVSNDGTTALIGAKYDEDPNGEGEYTGAGSAYVFGKSGGSWGQQAKLAADDGDGDDAFGKSVTLSSDGTTALLGAPGDEDPNGTDGFGSAAGSAYVFAKSSGSWSQQTKLAADGGNAGDLFGDSVAVSDDGTTAIIGAPGDEDPNGSGAGSAYVFAASSGTWSQQAKLAAADGDSGDEFGDSVALSSDGTTALMGAYDDEDPNGEVQYGSGAGSAYVFDV